MCMLSVSLDGRYEVMMSVPRLVMIHWIDAFDSENGWISLKDYKPVAQHVFQCGFMCDELVDGYVSVTGAWCPEPAHGEVQEVAMITHIPVGMIQSMVEVAVPEWGRSYPPSVEFDAT